MVEISQYGSGEGRGWVTGPGYSTTRQSMTPTAGPFGCGSAGLAAILVALSPLHRFGNRCTIMSAGHSRPCQAEIP